MPVIMPRVVPSRDEVYLCTAVDVSQSDGEFWVRGFEPRANMRNVHHMAVAGKRDLHVQISAQISVLEYAQKSAPFTLHKSRLAQ